MKSSEQQRVNSEQSQREIAILSRPEANLRGKHKRYHPRAEGDAETVPAL